MWLGKPIELVNVNNGTKVNVAINSVVKQSATALPCLFFGTKALATTAPTANIAPWHKPVKNLKNNSMPKLTLTPIMMLPIKKIIADHSKIYFRLSLKQTNGIKTPALITPII